MSIADAVGNATTEIVAQIQQKTAYFEQQFENGELSKADLDAQKQDAQFAQNRALNFAIRIGPDYQCPRCWIVNEIQSSLSPVPAAPGAQEDLLRCSRCNLEIAVPFGR